MYPSGFPIQDQISSIIKYHFLSDFFLKVNKSVLIKRVLLSLYLRLTKLINFVWKDEARESIV